MSSRWYPIFNRGNPQLRVFLPNFWMKIVKPDRKYPENTVVFQTSTEMTHHDVKNYLEKIYNVKTVDVKVEIKQGKTEIKPQNSYVTKKDDYKEAIVTLPRGEKFEFPKLFKDHEKELKELKEAQKNYTGYRRRNLHRPGVPGWFSL